MPVTESPSGISHKPLCMTSMKNLRLADKHQGAAYVSIPAEKTSDEGSEQVITEFVRARSGEIGGDLRTK